MVHPVSILSGQPHYLGKPENYDFDFFYTSFGPYVRPSRSRRGIDLVNQMERRLNLLAQEAFGEIMNPLKLSRYITRAEKDRRSRLETPERMARLKELIKTVRQFIQEDT